MQRSAHGRHSALSAWCRACRAHVWRMPGTCLPHDLPHVYHMYITCLAAQPHLLAHDVAADDGRGVARARKRRCGGQAVQQVAH